MTSDIKEFFVCSVVSKEDNWFNVHGSNGDVSGDLITDDFDNLKRVDFFWIDHNANGYSWHSDSVSQADFECYTKHYFKDSSDSSPIPVKAMPFYVNESSKSFTTWWEALDDIAHHIVFNYTYDNEFSHNVSRFAGICNFELSCDPFFYDMVRWYMYSDRNGDGDKSTFGRILDNTFLRQLKIYFEGTGT